jgi:NodT family efflux transporter outer membrane factor (OMF) lipoprotein
MNSISAQAQAVTRTQSGSRRLPASRVSVLLCAGLAACMAGPRYIRPSAPTPPAFKEAEGWAPATPSDAADRQDWWTVFGDPALNALEAKVTVSNQTLRADEAAYREAHALVAQDRAALFPTLSLDASATRSYSGSSGVSQSTGAGNGANGTGSFVGSGTRVTYQPSVGASWAPDVWGSVRRTIENARGDAQASAATLANARLSAQTELAVDYIGLRQLDEEKRILDETVAGYARTLAIVQNKYAVGVAAQSDVLSARSQLLSTQAQATDLAQQRARLEHAIAILTGEPPSALTLTPAPWSLALPNLPAAAPSALLQRRPDIAAAERQAAAASALIGVQIAAYYPTISLTGQGGYASSQLGQLFNASSSFWSLGASAAETVFDAGARAAKVRGARAAYDQAVANYRQTVLTAFGQVEDNLAAQRVYGAEEVQLKTASDVAAANERVTRNEYAAGTVDFTTVVTAQAAALTARNALLTVQADRLTTAVNLIEALGGGWTTAALPRD